MILTSRKFEQLTMPMMINALKSNDKIADYGVIYAGIALSIIPVVIIYLLLSRFIVAGVGARRRKGIKLNINVIIKTASFYACCFIIWRNY